MRNRILIVGPPRSGKLEIVKRLTGSLPVVSDGSHSGLSHELKIENKYYSLLLNIWVDEYSIEENEGTSDDLSSIVEWTESFCSEEAREVRDVLGAVVLTVDGSKASVKEDLDRLLKFTDLLDNELWNGSAVVVSRQPLAEDLGDDLLDRGLEFVHLADTNDEELAEKRGIDRLREILEMVPWQEEDEGEVDNQELSGESESKSIDPDPDFDNRPDPAAINALLTQGYSRPILGDSGSEEQVDDIDMFMKKIVSIRGKLLLFFTSQSLTRKQQIN